MHAYGQKPTTVKSSATNALQQRQSADALQPMAGLTGNQAMLAYLGQPEQPMPSATGEPIPNALREKFERRSGVSLEDVRVHHNSDKPEKFGAAAYAQGNEVFIGPGNEQDLQHEVGHVVQQKQGLVTSTEKIGKLDINDDEGLEHRANTQIEASGNRNKSGTADDSPVIQFSFQGALEKLTPAQLPEILQSYSLTEEEIGTIRANFEALKKSPMPYWSIPQIVKKYCGKARGEQIATAVKEKLINGAGSAGESITVADVLLRRADTRNPQEIYDAGGFFGREDAPITLEHARMHVEEICNADWVMAWKEQTKKKTEPVPYVATGTEEQKGGNAYTIKIPLFFPARSAAIKPLVGSDTGDLATATIIALKMRGGEVIILTGIPNKFIYYDEIPLEQYVQQSFD